MLQKLFGAQFCSVSHQSAYAHRQQEMFLARLHMHDASFAYDPIPSPPQRPPAIAISLAEPISFSAFIKC